MATPAARDYRSESATDEFNQKRWGHSRGKPLSAEATLASWATPTANEKRRRRGFSGWPFAERQRSPWAETEWIECRDGKRRPVESGTFPLAHGIPARVGKLRAYGNAIVAPVAAQFIGAFMECRP